MRRNPDDRKVLEQFEVKYFFLGASNPETIRMIASIKKNDASFCVGGFIDNDIKKHGEEFYGYPVLGGSDFVINLAREKARFINLITRSAILRYKTTKELVKYGAILGNFIHPSIDLTMVRIGVGNYFQEGVILQAGVVVGDNCSIHMGALIGHETHISNDTFVAHAVSISGCCTIGQGCFIGTNATIFPKVKIGNWVTVGAGSVVRKDIPDYSVVIGNPAKIIKTIKNPEL